MICPTVSNSRCTTVYVFNFDSSERWRLLLWRWDRFDGQSNLRLIPDVYEDRLLYIRLYQGTSDGTDMEMGCGPSTHPTAQWIEDHIEDYTDVDNPDTKVSGMGFCASNDDCTIDGRVITGTCSNGRCKCKSSSWKGPRCTVAGTSTTSTDSSSSSDDEDMDESYGPSMEVSSSMAGVTVVATLATVYLSARWGRRNDQELRKKILLEQQIQLDQQAKLGAMSMSDGGMKHPQDNYSANFV